MYAKVQRLGAVIYVAMGIMLFLNELCGDSSHYLFS